jgi:menaquinol-cytochrome c reductase iron-sulfur subunit
MTKPDQPETPADLAPRRGFIAKAVALLIGAAAYLPPVAAGAWVFLNPLRQKSQGGRMFRLATLETLDEVPKKFPVIADRTDAWNRFPNEPVGAVYLRKTGDDKVEAIHVVCPHAGCSVQYQAEGKKFFCPCHSASFDLAGARLDETSPSPRNLDTLDVEIRDGNEVWVKFANFRTGTPEKIEEA